MPELPLLPQVTVENIYKSYVDNNGDWRRDHLGASLIGQKCERRLWYTFRWASNPKFNGRMLRLFATGHNQEMRLISDLKKIGCTVYDVHPNTGKQINYTDFGGHYSGSLDAIAKGFQEAPNTWHVVECKTMNVKTFKQMVSKGVKHTKYEHFCQMQVYMGWSGLDRAMYIAVCKDTDEIYTERVYFEQDIFDSLRLKADRVVFSDVPLSKINDSPDSFDCKWCEHKDICHGKKLPEVNCRTCAYSGVIDEGWDCGKHHKSLGPLEQRGCHDCHIFIPQLVPLEVIDADADKGTVTYVGNIVNGPGETLSKDLQELVK